MNNQSQFSATRQIEGKVYELVLTFEDPDEDLNSADARRWAKQTRGTAFYSSARVVKNLKSFAVYGLPSYA